MFWMFESTQDTEAARTGPLQILMMLQKSDIKTNGEFFATKSWKSNVYYPSWLVGPSPNHQPQVKVKQKLTHVCKQEVKVDSSFSYNRLHEPSWMWSARFVPSRGGKENRGSGTDGLIETQHPSLFYLGWTVFESRICLYFSQNTNPDGSRQAESGWTISKWQLVSQGYLNLMV